MATVPVAAVPLNRHHCTYTACYCEENVYQLLQRLQQEGRDADNLYAVFISNSSESLPLWHQKASRRGDGLVVWDYHVIVLEVHPQSAAAPLVWDLDTLLPFPCTLQQYAQHALQADSIVLAPQYRRWYRLVAAATFLQHFASDRSHMRRPDGTWSAVPPTYPCIEAADGCTNNLSCYRDMMADVYVCGAAGKAAEGSSGGERRSTSHAGAWQQISNRARRCQYGVVLQEQQLLDCLLLNHSYR